MSNEEADDLRIILHQQQVLLDEVGEFLWKLWKEMHMGRDLRKVCEPVLYGLLVKVAPEGPAREG